MRIEGAHTPTAPVHRRKPPANERFSYEANKVGQAPHKYTADTDDAAITIGFRRIGAMRSGGLAAWQFHRGDKICKVLPSGERKQIYPPRM